MKKSIFILLSIAISFSAFAQPCYPDGISFSSQTEIDNFKIDNPDCSEIGGDLIISGDEVLNLDSLIAIVSVGGDLKISNNNYLTNIEGLSNLKSLGGNLVIESNHSLTSLSGLEGIKEIHGYLSLYYNVPGLLNMKGLNNLRTIGGKLSILYNYYLQDLSGLDSLTSVGGNLHLNLNEQLKNLEGLNHLNSVGGFCVFQENESLKNLDALSSLLSIGGDLAFVQNDSLIDISGVENIEASSILGLYIEGNPMLAECNIKSVCNYLLSPNGTTNIVFNDNGCNSSDEVEETCGITSEFELTKLIGVNIYPNPTTEILNITADSKIVEVIVTNLSGKIIYHKYPGNRITIINTLLFNSGSYNIRVITNQKSFYKRLIILR